VAVRKTG